MAIFEHGDVKIDVDEDGFMEEPDQWNEKVALALASTEGVDNLTEEHWKLVNPGLFRPNPPGPKPQIKPWCPWCFSGSNP